MKKIAIFIPTIKSGGAEKQATLLALLLSKENIVHFISFHGADKAEPLNENRLNSSSNIITHYLNGNIFKKYYQLGHILKEDHIEVVFNYLTYCDVYGSLIERACHVNKIYNGIRNSRLPKSKELLEKFCHNYVVTGTIFNCFSGQEYFQNRGFRKDKCFVIPNCYDSCSEPVIRKEKHIKKIITVGRFVEQKDYYTSLKTIAELRTLRKDFVFQIVGYGELESQIRLWIKQLNIEEFVEIYINPSNISGLLTSSDIYLSTSLFEGTSNSIMEAMNYSLPIVATSVGDNNYLVESSNGFLSDVKDVDSLVKNINILLDNYSLRISMGLQSNEKLMKEYSSNKFLSKYSILI